MVDNDHSRSFSALFLRFCAQKFHITPFLNKKSYLGSNYVLDLINFLFGCGREREHWHFPTRNYVCGNAFPEGSCSVTIPKARHTRYVSFPLNACHVLVWLLYNSWWALCSASFPGDCKYCSDSKIWIPSLMSFGLIFSCFEDRSQCLWHWEWMRSGLSWKGTWFATNGLATRRMSSHICKWSPVHLVPNILNYSLTPRDT